MAVSSLFSGMATDIRHRVQSYTNYKREGWSRDRLGEQRHCPFVELDLAIFSNQMRQLEHGGKRFVVCLDPALQRDRASLYGSALSLALCLGQFSAWTHGVLAKGETDPVIPGSDTFLNDGVDVALLLEHLGVLGHVLGR